MEEQFTSESDNQLLNCGLCVKNFNGASYRYPNFLLHLTECHQPLCIYACHFCGHGFCSKSKLLEHDCQLFQQFFDSCQFEKLTNKCFLYEFNSLICSKCGIQLGLSGHPPVNNDLFGELKTCLELHNGEHLVYCVVFSMDVCSFDSIKVSFLTTDRRLSSGPPESFLPTYVSLAFALQKNSNGDRVNDDPLYVDYGSRTEENDGKRSQKPIPHHRFFRKCEVDGTGCSLSGSRKADENERDSQSPQEGGMVAVYFECKICKYKPPPNPQPADFVQHIRDNHYAKPSSEKKRPFNAQGQYNKLDIGGGNVQYECKICGHLTKMNVKPNALSQHFNDRHPELRLLASESLIERYVESNEHLLTTGKDGESSSSVNDASNGGMSSFYWKASTKSLIMIDKDIKIMSAMSGTAGEYYNCEALIRISFGVKHIFYTPAPPGFELLSDDVFCCELCETLSMGISTARSHYDMHHKLEFSRGFNAFDHQQVERLFFFSKFGKPVAGASRPAVRCPFCESFHCSVLALKLHLYFFHDLIFQLLSRTCENGGDKMAPSNQSDSLCFVGETDQSISLDTIKQEVNADDFANNVLDEEQFGSMEQLLRTAISAIEDIRGGHDGIDDDREDRCASSKGSVSIIDKHDYDNNGEESYMSGTYTTNFDAELSERQRQRSADSNSPTSSAGGSLQQSTAYRVVAARLKRKEKLLRQNGSGASGRTRRFNAQEQFDVVQTPEGTRYQCKICGHLTKAYVSANTLSQHFSYRHPEVRANATGKYWCFKRKKNDDGTPVLSKKRLALVAALTEEAGKAAVTSTAGFNELGAASSATVMVTADSSSASDVGHAVASPMLRPPSTSHLFPPMASTSSLNGGGAPSKVALLSVDQSKAGCDDIVFGKFLETRSFDEFERLERSQHTVLPYFEILVKSNAHIASQIVGILSILYGHYAATGAKSGGEQQTLAAEICGRIANFTGEILRRSRTNGVNVLDNIGENLPTVQQNLSGISLCGLLKIVDVLLCRGGF